MESTESDEESTPGNSGEKERDWEKTRKILQRKAHMLLSKDVETSKSVQKRADQEEDIVECTYTGDSPQPEISAGPVHDPLFAPSSENTHQSPNLSSNPHSTNTSDSISSESIKSPNDISVNPIKFAPAAPEGSSPGESGKYPLSVHPDGPESSATDLLRRLQSGAISAEELSPEERRVVVAALKALGRTQDEIAGVLQVSRRTIVNDYRYLRNKTALKLKDMEVYDLAADIYNTCNDALVRALGDGKYRTVSFIMRDMVDMLQSIGVVYKAPARSMIAAKLQGSVLHKQQQGFGNYLTEIGEERDKVVNLLGQLLAGVEENKVR